MESRETWLWTLPDALTMKGGRDDSSKKGKQGQVKAFSKSEHKVGMQLPGRLRVALGVAFPVSLQTCADDSAISSLGLRDEFRAAVSHRNMMRAT